MLQYSRLNHSSKTGSTILKPSPDFSMKSLSTRVFLFLVMVRGATESIFCYNLLGIEMGLSHADGTQECYL